MKATMGKDENNVIVSTARLLNEAMMNSKTAEKVLLRFVRGVMQGHQSWGAYCLGRATVAAMEEKRTCRVCGCTETDACLMPELSSLVTASGSVLGHGTCSWVEEDLCSACVQLDRQLKEMDAANG
jgi:hypothetical protein